MSSLGFSSSFPGAGKTSGGFRWFAAAFAFCVLSFAGCNSVTGGVFGVKVSGGVVTADPPAATVARGGTKSFTTEVDGTDDQRVTWTILEAADNPEWNAGTRITTEDEHTGRLSVAIDEKLESLTVRATALADTSGGTFTDIAITVMDVFITGVMINPPSAEVEPGNTRQFSVTVEGMGESDAPVEIPQTVEWSVVDSGVKKGTAIDKNGLLTVSKDETLPVLRIKAVSDLNENKFGVALVTVPHGTYDGYITGLKVTPASATVTKGESALFIATVTGEGNVDPSVVWSVDENTDAGTVITSDGVLTVYRDEPLDRLTVVATSIAAPDIYGDATVTLKAAEAEIPEAVVTDVTVSPVTAEVAQGGTKQFTAAVTGEGVFDPSVVWNVEEAGKMPGTGITSGGRLAVDRNEALTTLHVRATSVRDSAKYGRAEVTVTPFGSGIGEDLESAPFDSLLGSDTLTITLTDAKFTDPLYPSYFTLGTAGTPGFASLEGGQITPSGDTVVTITALAAVTTPGSGQKIIIAGAALAERGDGAGATVTASASGITDLESAPFDSLPGNNTLTITLTDAKFTDPLAPSYFTLGTAGTPGFANLEGGQITPSGDTVVTITTRVAVTTPGSGQKIIIAGAALAERGDGAGATVTASTGDGPGPVKYTVTLSQEPGEGGTPIVTVALNSPMPDIIAPLLDAYIFGGYFTQTEGGGTQYYNSDGTGTRNWDIAEDTMLYAKWTADDGGEPPPPDGTEYTITLDRQGGTGGTESVTAAYGSPMPAIIRPARTGWTFGGYFTQTEGGGAQYYKADGTSARDWDIAASITLYALWTDGGDGEPVTGTEYTVMLDQQDGTGGTPSVRAAYGSAMPAITRPARTGYVFDGYWTAQNGGGTQYYTADGTSARTWDIAGDTTLYAFWTTYSDSIGFPSAVDDNCLTITLENAKFADTLLTSYFIVNPVENGGGFADITTSEQIGVVSDTQIMITGFDPVTTAVDWVTDPDTGYRSGGQKITIADAALSEKKSGAMAVVTASKALGSGGSGVGSINLAVPANSDGSGWIYAKVPRYENETDGYDFYTEDYVFIIFKSSEVTATGITTENRILVGGSGTGTTLTLNGASIRLNGGRYVNPLGLAHGADVTLLLKGDNTLTTGDSGPAGGGAAAIHAPNGTTLTINSADGDGQTSGTLTVVTNQYGTSSATYQCGAGIGGNINESGGNITISGGTVDVTGGYYAAGIGGGSPGNRGYYGGAGGAITITGGGVTVKGGGGGAGIGGGVYRDGGTITITGGTVNATGGGSGAGIGGGDYAGGGTITITGGMVTAKGGGHGAGIGGGGDGESGTIIISAGTVDSTGGSWGAGIGSGGGTHVIGSGDITISGGTVTAKGGSSGAGIGGGFVSPGGKITITGGDVTATGGGGYLSQAGYCGGGAGIGGGGNDTVYDSNGGAGGEIHINDPAMGGGTSHGSATVITGAYWEAGSVVGPGSNPPEITGSFNGGEEGEWPAATSADGKSYEW